MVKPMRTLSPTHRRIAARHATIAQRAAVSPKFKAALEKLGTKLAAELDEAIAEALRRHEKRDLAPVDLEALRERVSCARLPGQAEETWMLGAVPILRAGQIEVEQEGNKLRARQTLQQLLPEWTP